VRYGSLVRRPLGFHLVEQLEGHVALVTGGNGGIGLGLAQGLVKAGADVAIWGTNVDKSADAVRHLESLRGSGSILALRCDITDEAQVVGAFADTVEHFGKVDSVFANAGIPGASPRFVDLSLDEWRRVMAVNLDGTFLTLREGARHLVARDQGGALIALSSIAALHGAPRRDAYAASKTAVQSLVRSLAISLATSRIRVNALCPGWTNTELLGSARASQKFIDRTVERTPAGRWATPDEYEKVAVFLADPSLTFHTGASLVVDGGYTIF
jgi:NAD(P)-dependent dehydrogenase (short-subunit alcohol dehydrogenase family)